MHSLLFTLILFLQHRKVEEIFATHDMVTVPETEKFVIVVKAIKDGGLLECTYNGKPLANMRLPAAGALREAIHKALKSGSVNVEAMATFGQRGPVAIVGSNPIIEHDDESSEADDEDNSNNTNSNNEADENNDDDEEKEEVEQKSTESEESD
jgi:hypothetical protein